MQKIIILFLILTLSFSTALSFSGNGSGTEEDPYQITNVHQLQEMNDELSAHYILMNDIDASETREWNVGDHDEDPDTHELAMGFKPIGKLDIRPNHGFNGSLNGQSFKIINLYIYYENNCIGLFGVVVNGARIYDVHIEDAVVEGIQDIGIMAGIIHNFNDSMEIIIENCTTNGTVISRHQISSSIGGFCGHVFAGKGQTSIVNCKSSGIVNGGSNVGGFCGLNRAYNGKTLIKECISESIVSGYNEYNSINNIGGFCGKNITHSTGSSANIEDCYSIGNVNSSGKGAYIGGFCGGNTAQSKNSYANIIDCYSTGDLTTNGDYAGGFCGWNYTNWENCHANIEFCYNSGNVSSNGDYAGGFIGANYAVKGECNISECYSSGNIIAEKSTAGFCYSNQSQQDGLATIINCYSSGSVESNTGFSNSFSLFNSEYQSTSLISHCYCNGLTKGGQAGTFGISKSETSGDVNYCYWDMQTTDISESIYGEGKTTAEMMMQSTFENWDFDNIWCIVEGQTYPQLQHFVDCDTLVSVQEIISNEGIEIYPNPASDRIIISSSQYIQRIKIVNMLGDVIKDVNLKRFSKEHGISVGDLPNGVYMVILETINGYVAEKIIVI